jgi:pyruvate,orthophosphate dikinase
VAEEVFGEKGAKVHYTVGAISELPRAALIVDEIAKQVEFIHQGREPYAGDDFWSPRARL